MARRIHLGRFFGIPIHLDASWFIILGLVAWTLAGGYFPLHLPQLSAPLYWLMGFSAAVLLFLCVLSHELGHSLVAQAFGIPVNRVTLFIFGGVAQIASDPKRPFVELIVALAGPIVSIVIAVACLLASNLIPAKTTAGLIGVMVCRYLATVNIAIVAFNLLPGFPLDGGRVLRAALWAWSGNLRQATKIASVMGSGLGIGLLILGFVSIFRGIWIGGLWYVLLGMFLRDAARAGYQELLVRQAVQQTLAPERRG